LSNPIPEDLRSRLEGFVRYRRENLRGDEKGEAQVFLDRLFQAFGYGGVYEAGATLEERVRRRDNGGTAFADLIWKPRVLVEMKRSGRDLARDYRQAFNYWIDSAPDRPAYVVLSNFDEFWIYDLNRQLDEPVDRVVLDDLPRRWEAMAFLLPEPQRPEFHNDLVQVTRQSAAKLAQVFNHLVGRGVERADAQRFILQTLMGLFAEDIGLLSTHSFSTVIEDCLEGGSTYDLLFGGLFREMNMEGRTPHGRFEGTPYFNGGLFREVAPIELEREELQLIYEASREDWSQVRPAIFGTLFEQSLDKDERHAFGAHFTSEVDIQKVVLPTIVRPWQDRIDEATTLDELAAVETELINFQVLDPACGCGNFLYVAYRELRRLERQLVEKIRDRSRRASADAELRMTFLSTKQFHGIDINAFATEVAKVTLMLARKLAADELGDERSVLPLDDLDDNFIANDALRVTWPAFDVCIGNPPYLGRRRIIDEYGADYSAWLGERFPDVGGVSDYVSYWFRKAHDLLPRGKRAGLVGTRAIRTSDTRIASLDYIVENGGVIYEAVSQQPWSGDAVVEVSIVNWIKDGDVNPKTLWVADGTVKLEVDQIPASLSPDIDVAAARDLEVNKHPQRCFQGITPGHTTGFMLDAAQVADLFEEAPEYREIVHPYLTGQELGSTGVPGRWVIDIPDDELTSAQRWARAIDKLRFEVLPVRRQKAEAEAARNAEALERNSYARVNWHHRNFYERWWQLAYRRAELLEAIASLDRYVAISRVAVEDRPSIYGFVSSDIWPSDALQVFAFDDDYSFGILNSSLHRTWFEARCSRLRRDLRYTSSTVFDSFPWPQAPTDETVKPVVDVVERLIAHRDERIASGIRLGQLYASLRDPGRNALRDLHEELDAAVFDLYGFSRDDDALTQLLALNESVAEEERAGLAPPRAPGPAGLAGTRRTDSRIDVPAQQ
jgi:hypothetical protein